MSLSDPRQNTQVCPRCTIALPLNQIVCTNCGFSVASLQSGRISNTSQIPTSGVGQFKGIGLPPARIPEASQGHGSSLGISQSRGGQVPLLAAQPAKDDRVAPIAVQPVKGDQVLMSQSRRDQVPMLAGLHTDGRTPSSVASQAPSSSNVKKEKLVRKHATLVYFITVMLVFVVVAVTGLHAAGISLATLAPRGVATPTVTYALPKVAPLFADTFVNDASGWNLQSSPGSYQVTVGNGTLAIEVNKNKLLWEPLPGAISYGDFTLTVNAVITQGDQNNGYGLYIRGAPGPDSDLDTYYRFELYGDASYAIFKGILDQSGGSLATKIVNYTLSSAIQKRGKLNHIMLIAKGDALSFIVNGQLLKTFVDTSYASGAIALFASNLPGAQLGVQVQFSQLALYPRQVVNPS